MAAEKSEEKQTKPLGFIRANVSFWGTGPDEGKSLRQIIEEFPGGDWR